MTANLSHHRPDGYGPQHPWRSTVSKQRPPDSREVDYSQSVLGRVAMAVDLVGKADLDPKNDDLLKFTAAVLKGRHFAVMAARAVAEIRAGADHHAVAARLMSSAIAMEDRS